jgi:phosphate-selective porin OprO/OprP
MITSLLLASPLALSVSLVPPPGPGEGDGFQIQLFGRYQVDWQDYDPDADVAASELQTDLVDALRLRSLRLGVRGQFTRDIPYRVDYEMKGVTYRAPRNIWIGYDGLSLGHLRVGHMKEPFGLERLGSARNTMMIERGLVNTLTPGRNLGAMISHGVGGGRMTWAAGFFRTTQHLHQWDDDGEHAFTGRITALPLEDRATERLVHIGASWSHRTPDGDPVGFSTDPEAAFAPDYLDTGTVDANTVDTIGLECAYVEGPWTVQSEWMRASVDAVTGPDPHVSSYYIMVGHFLSHGDRRAYEKDGGRFGGVTPLRPFGPGGGGAWEAVFRYSYADFESRGFDTGNELWTMGLGINWYLEAHARLSLNLVTADLNGVGDTDMLLARFQVSF